MKPSVLIVGGPTAAGKKTFALDAARFFDGEIVSADSRKVYRGMDIGTAKPAIAVRDKVPHHLIDIVDPDDPFSAWDWLVRASTAVKEILEHGKLPILSGGTGFYIAAFIDGLTPGITADPSVRKALEREMEECGTDALYDELKRLDPERAGDLHPNDVLRVIRALEICRATGETFTTFRDRPRVNGGNYRYLSIGITRERHHLYERINNRVDAMIDAGLIDEIRSLLDHDYDRSLTAFDTVGYKEWFDYIEGRLGFDECFEAMKRNTRRYAKRQMTWFRARPEIHWFDPDILDNIEKANGLIEAFIKGEYNDDAAENS